MYFLLIKILFMEDEFTDQETQKFNEIIEKDIK